MSFMKRITATVSARVDRLVTVLENHDALVEAAIREARQDYARAKVRQSRMREQGEHLRERLEDSRRGATRWRERALSCDDEDKALECLRRSRQASAQAKGLEETSRRHNEAEQRLGRDIERVRARIEQLQQKRHLLRSREATAQAASGIQRLDDTLGLGLDDTFERWEARVMEAEFAAGTVCDKDSLQSEFVTTEERASLKAELEALKGRGVGDED